VITASRNCVVCRKRNDSMALTFENWIGCYKKGVYSQQKRRAGLAYSTLAGKLMKTKHGEE
jgi:hypothetical protein